MTTLWAATVATFVTRTSYSSCPPASAAPPPTTATCLSIMSCWPLPTTTTVGSGPVAGLPSPSVSRFGSSALPTTAWFMISVPAGVPASTCRSNSITALSPGFSVPALRPGNGGVRSDDEIPMPAASGETPPSGTPTGRPLSRSESGTQVVFAGTLSISVAAVAGMAPVLLTLIV